MNIEDYPKDFKSFCFLKNINCFDESRKYNLTRKYFIHDDFCSIKRKLSHFNSFVSNTENKSI
jgi:hypothetical protein